MRNGIIFAGAGGQGALLAGKLLAQAATLEGKHVTWYPSYGAEMRGGKANCSVIISDTPIGAPVIKKPDVIVTFNGVSLEAFAPLVAPGGHIIYNSSLSSLDEVPQDVTALPINANQLAIEIGNLRTVNVIMLGATLAARNLVKPESIMIVLKETLSKGKEKLIEVNQKALDLGLAEGAKK